MDEMDEMKRDCEKGPTASASNDSDATATEDGIDVSYPQTAPWGHGMIALH